MPAWPRVRAARRAASMWSVLDALRSIVAFWRVHGIVGDRGRPPREVVGGGMHRWIDALAADLIDRGVSIRCGVGTAFTVVRTWPIPGLGHGLGVAFVDLEPERSAALDASGVAASLAPRPEPKLQSVGLRRAAQVVSWTRMSPSPRSRATWRAGACARASLPVYR